MSLPETYQQVEYIESTGTQYIDTGYIPVQGFSLEMDNVSINHTENPLGALFSAGTGNYMVIFLCGTTYGRYYYEYFQTGTANEIPVFSLNKASIKVDSNGVLFINNTQYSVGHYTAPVNSSLNIFRQVKNDTRYIKAKVGIIKIYTENNILVRNFIPCYRKSDNEIGMYDAINDVFYTNSGTGTFLKGPDVNIASKLKYINDTKQLIKQSLIYKGEDISNSDTFRDYVNKINNLHTTAIDWTDIGYYNDEPLDIIDDGYDYAVEIQQNWQNISNLSEKFSEDRDMKYMPLVDTSNATNMSKFMYNCYRLETLPELNTSNVTNMSYALYNCRALKTVPNIDFSNVTNLSYAFYYNTSLEYFEANSIDTSKVTNWSYTFAGCNKLSETEINKFDFSGASGNPKRWFDSCQGLTNLTIQSLPNITGVDEIFYNCKNLKTINLPNMPKLASTYAPFHSSGIETIIAFDTSHAANVSQLFYNASRITNIPVMDFSNVTYFGDLFFYSSGQNLTDQSLNNLMESLISATKYTGTKTLKYINLPKVKCQRCMELEKYQDFVNAGWLTGYEE